MFELLLNYILKYKVIIIFYILIILFLVWKRKRLDFQAKIIILYRTKFGLKFIERCVQKFREEIILLGYIGVGAGYIGLVFISYLLLKNLYDLITSPAAVSEVSLVLPGINVPGLGVLPFWYWIIAIFVIAIIHEFSHGIVAKAYQVDVENTGFVFLGPIIGAFVEPNEKKLRKQKDIVQYSILAAGSFSNILLGIVLLLFLPYVANPLALAPYENQISYPVGFSFTLIDQTLPAAQAGLKDGMTINQFNGETINSFSDFTYQMLQTSPGEKLLIGTDQGEFKVTAGKYPGEEFNHGYVGIQGMKDERRLNSGMEFWGKVYYWFKGFFRWLFFLSLGIGMFNLLPLPLVDGGRMTQVYLHKRHGSSKGENWYRRISVFFFLVLILNLVYPLLKGWLGV